MINSKTYLILILTFFFCFSLFGEDNYSPQTGIDQIISSLLSKGVFDRDKYIEVEKKYKLEKRSVDILYNILHRNYCEKYFNKYNENIEELEITLHSYYNQKIRLNYLIFYTNRYIFNPYLEREYNFFLTNKDKFEEKMKAEVNYAIHLFEGLKHYNTVTNKDREAWIYIYDRLSIANNIKPLELHTSILIETYEELQNYRELFLLNSYRYIDREDYNFFRELELYFLYKKIKYNKDNFSVELENVKQKLRKDVIKHIREQNKPKHLFKRILLKNINGERTLIDPTDKSSKYYGKKIITVFLNTNCSNCIKEIKSLNRIEKQLKKDNQNIEIIGIYTFYKNEDTAMEELKTFQKNYNITFPLYLDEKTNKTSLFFSIMSVPNILLVNSNSRINATVSFKNYGHLNLKLLWTIEEFFQIK